MTQAAPPPPVSPRGPQGKAPGVVPALLAFAALAGCTSVDPDQARACRIALPVLEAPGTTIAVRASRAIDRGVRIEYRAGERDAFAECRFTRGRRTELETVTTDRGDVPGATVYLLRRYYLETPDGAAADPGDGSR